ncbi:Sec-independent protein translocase protein TatA [Candidatus Pantoea carbekii]|uniref:Sec-independent protein translocase protein TatA n=1 Tax=Candidatus Pantoea carbekii TaxID=1235990 RepID=U3U8N5_9GAMM|nr:twin-arginine translocase TatA/TatE family subunit [Candidatus Pantoea carbekii]AKC32262.1 Sec-independent protein translocase protein TatA [Candidatus Pantoea carbekii]BAN99972.1 TatA protein [Candidatus Pantoea carbekii]
MGTISVWQLLIIAVIVVILFGTDKLRNFGSDLGSSIRGFRKAINDNKEDEQNQTTEQDTNSKTPTLINKEEISMNKNKTEHK